MKEKKLATFAEKREDILQYKSFSHISAKNISIFYIFYIIYTRKYNEPLTNDFVRLKLF